MAAGVGRAADDDLGRRDRIAPICMAPSGHRSTTDVRCGRRGDSGREGPSMIDRTRDLIRNVRSLVTPSGAAPDVARPVELTISAPGISEGTHAALRARMQKWLEVR